MFEGLLTELSKVNAPSMTLSEFNYYLNKAVNQYVNKRYNLYDLNQQTTDDLRVLKATAMLDVEPVLGWEKDKQYGTIEKPSDYKTGSANLFGATYQITLPDDYLHMLNCICIYYIDAPFKCYDKGDYVQFAAKRLTADAWSTIVNDYYNRPTPERPYYYINNVNTSNQLPTNPYDKEIPGTTDQVFTGIPSIKNDEGTYQKPGQEYEADATTPIEFTRTIKLSNKSNKPDDTSVVEKPTALRHSNTSKVRCEIRYGKDDTVFKLNKVFIDYIKSPQVIRLTQEQVDLTLDTSQLLEFPDYVCQEIINELILLVMEKTADPRTQGHLAVTQSIANPAQPQQPQQRGQ